MNLQESIKKVLREEISIKEKLKNMIDKSGTLNTVRAVGGYKNFKKVYGDDLTKNEKVGLITDIVKKYGEDEGQYIEAAYYDIFIDTTHNKTGNPKYTTEIVDIYNSGYYSFRQYGYDENLDNYDYEEYYDGMENLIDLSNSDLDYIISVLTMVNSI